MSINSDLVKAGAVRGFRTVWQGGLAAWITSLMAGASMGGFGDWQTALVVGAVAGVTSFVTCLFGVPEVTKTEKKDE